MKKVLSKTKISKKKNKRKKSITDVVEKKYTCWPDAVPRKDWTGMEQGNLLILQPVYKLESKEGGVWFYLCQCKCGNETIIAARRSTKSCGCLQAEANLANLVKARAVRLGTDIDPVKPKPVIPVKKPFDSVNTCMYKGYRCDRYKAEFGRNEPRCFGDRCYINKYLAMGYY